MSRRRLKLGFSLINLVPIVLLIFLSGCAQDMALSYALHAKYYDEKGLHDETIKSAKQSTQYAPSYAPGWYWLGIGNYRKGNYDEAIPALKKVIELRPAGPQYHSSLDYLGWAYYNKSKYSEAINYFAKSLELSPKDVSSLSGIGWSHYWLDDYDSALKYFNKIIEITVTYDSIIARAWAYYAKGQTNEAYADADRAISLNSQKEGGYRIRGWVHYFRGSYQDAISDLNLSIEKITNDTWAPMARQHALRGKAFSYLGLGDTVTAVNLVKSANDALNYEMNHDLSLIYFIAGDMDKAWEHRGGSGMVGLEVKNYDKAGIKGAAVVKISPGSPAEKAGIYSGDVVVGVGDSDVGGVEDFIKKAKVLVPGSTARLMVLREGVKRQVDIVAASAEPLLENDSLIAPIMAKKKTGTEAVAGAPYQPVSSSKPFPSKTYTGKSDVDKLPLTKGKVNKNAYAIVIGIENYRQKLPKADFAAYDAQIITEYLTQVMGYPEENVVTLINERAALGDMVKYFEKWLGNNVEKGSTVFIYYSGHGAPNPKTGDAFLVPYDGDPSFIDQTGYSLKKLYNNLNRLQAKEIIVALDSCFSGAGGRSVLAKGARPLVMNMEQAMTAGGKIAILSAAQGDQISSTYDEKGHGLFTYFMLKGIKEGHADIESLYNYLKPGVEKIARKLFNNEQSPQLIAPAELLKLKIIDR